MSKYQLPKLDDGWKWHLDTDNPAKIALWAYRDGGPFRHFDDVGEKILIGTFDAGYKYSKAVAEQIFDAAEKSMNWGSWSVLGRDAQSRLREHLGL